MSSKPELISFDICPFVQRSVITLLEKGVDFDVTYIDLANKPDWFLKISPFGKVPVLKTGRHVLFESAVINEYLDEINPPLMHPIEPLDKAHNRAWIEFSSQLNMDLFHWAIATDQDAHDKAYERLMNNLSKVESQVDDEPFFNGDDFMLVDAAYAPFFMRLDIVSAGLDKDLLKAYPKCQAWQNAMKVKESVMKSVPADITEKFLNYIRGKNSILANNLSK